MASTEAGAGRRRLPEPGSHRGSRAGACYYRLSHTSTSEYLQVGQSKLKVAKSNMIFASSVVYYLFNSMIINLKEFLLVQTLPPSI